MELAYQSRGRTRLPTSCPVCGAVTLNKIIFRNPRRGRQPQIRFLFHLSRVANGKRTMFEWGIGKVVIFALAFQLRLRGFGCPASATRDIIGINHRTAYEELVEAKPREVP